MEEKKLKEIEAKLYQLLTEVDKSKKAETPPPGKACQGAAVIRRRKGQMDLQIA